MLEIVYALMLLAFGAVCAGLLYVLLGPWMAVAAVLAGIAMAVQEFRKNTKHA